MNYKEILEVLKNSELEVSEFCDGNFDEQELGLGRIEEVNSYGGEGQGDDYWSVKHFVDHDIYIKVSGWYQSHHGTEFTGWDSSCSEVKPKEKTITVYE